PRPSPPAPANSSTAFIFRYFPVKTPRTISARVSDPETAIGTPRRRTRPTLGPEAPLGPARHAACFLPACSARSPLVTSGDALSDSLRGGARSTHEQR